MINRLTDYRGAEYYTELWRILNSEEGQAIINEAQEVLATGKLTPFDLCVITLNHNLPFKAVCEWLERNKVIPTGVHDRLIARGFKVNEALREVSEKMKEAA
jgi:hypothetical protein